MSVAALALGLFWPRPAIVADCDPAGGDFLPGILMGQFDPARGVAGLASAAGRGELDAAFFGHLIDVDPPHGKRLLLPGIGEPSQAGGMAAIADELAVLFTGLEINDPAYDVFVDCGRLGQRTPWPLIVASDVVVLAARGTLPSLAHSQFASAELRRRLVDAGRDPDVVRLLLVDDGPYVGEAGRRLGVPRLGVLDWDRRTAGRLSYGGEVRATSRLIRSAAVVNSRLQDLIADARPRLTAAVNVGAGRDM